MNYVKKDNKGIKIKTILLIVDIVALVLVRVISNTLFLLGQKTNPIFLTVAASVLIVSLAIIIVSLITERRNTKKNEKQNFDDTFEYGDKEV